MPHVISGVLKSLGCIYSSYFGWILPNSKPNKEKDPITIRFRKLKNLVTKVNKNLKIEYHVEGLENIPEDLKCAYLPNHMSAYDPLAVISCLDTPTTFISKLENKKIPVIGKIITAMDGIYIDRKDLKQIVDAMLSVEHDLKEQNKNWIIFPEGSRIKDVFAPMQEFRRGIFRSVMKAQAPIVPVAMYGTHKSLSNKQPLKKYPIYISFLKPILPEEYKDKTPDEICLYCKEMMQKKIDELRVKYFSEIEKLFRRKKDLEQFKKTKLA